MALRSSQAGDGALWLLLPVLCICHLCVVFDLGTAVMHGPGGHHTLCLLSAPSPCFVIPDPTHYTQAAAAEGHHSLILQCVINVSYCLAAGCRRHQGMEANIDTAARTIVRCVVSILSIPPILSLLSIVSILSILFIVHNSYCVYTVH